MVGRRISLTRLTRIGARVGAISFDQGLSSASNLIASVIAAHLLAPAEFGAFGIMFATYMMTTYLVRSATGEVLLLVGERRAVCVASVNLVIAALMGLLAGLILLALALWFGGAIGAGLVPLGIGLTGLTLQDTLRYVGFATRRVSLAIVTDTLWLLFMILLFATILWGSPAGIGEVAALWVASGVLAALCALPLARCAAPSLAALRQWLAERRGLMASMGADRGLVSISQQGVTYIIAALIGLEGNAAYRAAQIVMGPINIVAVGLMATTAPYLARIWAERPAALVVEARRITIAGALVILVLTQVAAHIPDVLGRLLIGRSWLLGKPVLEIMALSVLAQSFNFAALAALRVIGSAKSVVFVRLVVVPASLAVIALAASLGGLRAAMGTQAMSAALFSSLWWVMILRHYRSKVAAGRPTETSPSPARP